MLRLLALDGKGGRGMARPEENLVSMRMERNQFMYSRFTFSYQSFLFKRIAISHEKEVVQQWVEERGVLASSSPLDISCFRIWF